MTFPLQFYEKSSETEKVRERERKRKVKVLGETGRNMSINCVPAACNFVFDVT